MAGERDGLVDDLVVIDLGGRPDMAGERDKPIQPLGGRPDMAGERDGESPDLRSERSEDGLK
jgi:hypothetical protein